jgi:NADPH:quinone reductase
MGGAIRGTMRAIQIGEFGGPEVLRPAELPIPEPAAGEVLIEVSRAGVNFADTHTRTGSYVGQAPLPLVPGGEVVGRVVRVGVDMDPGGRARAGARRDEDKEGQIDRAVQGGEGTGTHSARGESPREGERVVALTGTGGYAQYATVPAAHAWPVPEEIDDGTALALIVQGTTAWHLYRTAGRVAEGESVVVHSASGGVGSLAVQLGHALGAGRVIGTASSSDRRDLARQLGADAAVDPAPEGLTERLIEANGGEPVDVVFDMAGGETFDASYGALACFGRIVVCGISSEHPNELRTGSLLRHSRGVAGFYLFHCLKRPGMFGQALADLFARAGRGELRAVVGGTYPLSEAAQAHIDLRARRTSGKLLLDPGGRVDT